MQDSDGVEFAYDAGLNLDTIFLVHHVTIPEPATASLLTLTPLTLIHRRRRN